MNPGLMVCAFGIRRGEARKKHAEIMRDFAAEL
jgi:hypothetical protein